MAVPIGWAVPWPWRVFSSSCWGNDGIVSCLRCKVHFFLSGLEVWVEWQAWELSLLSSPLHFKWGFCLLIFPSSVNYHQANELRIIPDFWFIYEDLQVSIIPQASVSSSANSCLKMIIFNIFYWLCYYSCPIFASPSFPSALYTPSHHQCPTLVHVHGSYM